MPQKFKNILIFKPSSLGDIVLALPALSALRKGLPSSKISWLVRPEFAPLLKNHPHLDDIILFDRKFLGKAWYHPKALAALLSLIRLLRSRKFDVVIDLQGLFRTAFLAWLTGCKKRFGMSNARELSPLFYTDKIHQDTNCIHLVDYYLKIVRLAGAGSAEPQFILPEDSDAEKAVQHLLAEHGIDKDKYAVIVPGARRSKKCWPADRFAAIAGKISSQFNLAVVAVGTAPQKSLVEKIQSLTGIHVANLAGATTLAQLVALIRKAAIVVSNDTGPGHIAAALQRPLVMIFGRTNPRRLAPYKRENCIVTIEPENRGQEINSKDPKYDVKNITVEEVFEKVSRQIQC